MYVRENLVRKHQKLVTCGGDLASVGRTRLDRDSMRDKKSVCYRQYANTCKIVFPAQLSFVREWLYLTVHALHQLKNNSGRLLVRSRHDPLTAPAGVELFSRCPREQKEEVDAGTHDVREKNKMTSSSEGTKWGYSVQMLVGVARLWFVRRAGFELTEG